MLRIVEAEIEALASPKRPSLLLGDVIRAVHPPYFHVVRIDDFLNAADECIFFLTKRARERARNVVLVDVKKKKNRGKW